MMEQAIPIPAAAPRRVLIVDDALTVRLYCRQVLHGAGFEVREAVNGLEGLEIALQTGFDLFAVDVNMQKMDGYAFLAEARRTPALAHVPALMMSTEAAVSDVDQAYAAGANFYLYKPIQPDRLIEAARLLTGTSVQ